MAQRGVSIPFDAPSARLYMVRFGMQRLSMGCSSLGSFGLSLQTIDHPASQLDCCLVLGVAPLDVVQREFRDISDAR